MKAYYNEIDPYVAQWLRNLIKAGHIAPGDVDERGIADVRAAIGYVLKIRGELDKMGALGCDDAPVVEVCVGSSPLRHVTFIYPYYENPQFLAKQFELWESYADVLRQRLSVIIVDDGSPLPLVKAMTSLPLYVDLSIYRIEVDIRWNWLAARNVGAFHADNGWLLLTDMDHMVRYETFRALIHGEFDPNVIYRFQRVENGRLIHPHPNSWFMTRKMYWKIGGYDEALSGFYGTDGDYRRRCAATAPIKIINYPLERHEHEGDSSTRRYKRKQPEDATGKRIAKARGPNWQPKVLSFPYHQELLEELV